MSQPESANTLASTAERPLYPWLDCLRFVAACLVVLCHTRCQYWVEYAALPAGQQNILTQIFFLFTRLGNEAVIVFFVMSGFLVGGRSLEKALNGKFELRSYCLDRSVRIMLPLFGALLFAAGCDALLGRHVPFLRYVGNLFSLQNILCRKISVPYWTMPYEVLTYFIIGVLCVLLSRGTASTLRTLALIVLSIVCLACTRLQFVYFLIILIGVTAYFVRLPRSKTMLTLLLLAVPACLLLLQFTLVTKSRQRLPLSYDCVLIVFGVLLAALVSQLLNFSPVSSLSKRLNAWGKAGSAFSYTLYLVHYPIVELNTKFMLNGQRSPSLSVRTVGLWLAEVVVCFLISYGVYWLFESRTRAVRSFFQRKLFADSVPAHS